MPYRPVCRTHRPPHAQLAFEATTARGDRAFAKRDRAADFARFRGTGDGAGHRLGWSEGGPAGLMPQTAAGFGLVPEQAGPSVGSSVTMVP